MEVSRWSREGTPVTLLRGGGGVRGPGPGSRRRFRSATGQSLQANAAALAAPAALSPHPWHRTGSAPRPGQESADEDPARPGDVPSEEKAGAAGRSWPNFLESKLLAAQSKAVERRLRRATGLPRRGGDPPRATPAEPPAITLILAAFFSAHSINNPHGNQREGARHLMSKRILPCGIRWQFLALLLSLVVAGCDDSIISIISPISPISPTDDDSIVPPTDATVATKLSIFLKDDPGDVDIVWVQVDDVVLVGQGAPISLLDEPTDLINLTELVDVAVALVEGVAVEPGLYTQVRFVLGGAVLLAGDGNVYGYGDVEAPPGLEITGDLTCPSCSQSGIKVQLPGGVTLAEGDDAGVLIDFDIAQSFGHQAGQSGKWVMHPVILGKVDDPGAIETKDDADDDDPDEFKGIAALVSVEGDAPTRTVRVELTNVTDRWRWTSSRAARSSTPTVTS